MSRKKKTKLPPTKEMRYVYNSENFDLEVVTKVIEEFFTKQQTMLFNGGRINMKYNQS